MSRTSHILIAGALLALFAVPTWAQTGLLRGTVVDNERNPISGVQVTVTSEELASYRKTLTTDKKGQIKLRFQHNQAQFRFQMLFEKPGFGSFTVPFKPSMTQQMREQWVMEEAESQAVPQSHGDLGAVVTGTTNTAIEAFNAGLTAQRESQLDTARTKFQEALAEDPELAPAQLSLAQVQLDLESYADAVVAADRALELGVNRAEALRVKYQALRASGRNEEAKAVSASLAEADGAVASAKRLYNEGGQAFKADDKETALAKFQQAAELDPSLTDAHHAIATLHYGKGNYQASADAAEKALSMGSEDLRTLRVLYDAYDSLGRTEELAEIAPRLAAVDPDFGGSKLVEQAAANWNAGQAEQAVQLSRLALSMDPNLAKAYYFIGLDHLSSGENAEAKASLQKFVELAPDDPDAAAAKEMMSYIE
ncbi:MAG: tetratricopeptide repeat protein [Acidobacteriota bacterium]